MADMVLPILKERGPYCSASYTLSTHMRTEILILGGGVIGSSVAWHLARRGVRDVTVVDRGGELGAGSTGKATGGYRAQFDNETEVRLSLLARRKLIDFAAETGVDSGYLPSGYLFLASS